MLSYIDSIHVSMLFFFNDTATTEIYTLPLHDALPISTMRCSRQWEEWEAAVGGARSAMADRKSTRLNSSHTVISYAVFCLKKKVKKSPDVYGLYISFCCSE